MCLGSYRSGTVAGVAGAPSAGTTSPTYAPKEYNKEK